MKSLELVVSGGEVAPVEGCGGGSEARKQRLLAPCGKSRILHQPNQNCYSLRRRNHFHSHVGTADAEREGIVQNQGDLVRPKTQRAAGHSIRGEEVGADVPEIVEVGVIQIE